MVIWHFQFDAVVGDIIKSVLLLFIVPLTVILVLIFVLRRRQRGYSVIDRAAEDEYKTQA